MLMHCMESIDQILVVLYYALETVYQLFKAGCLNLIMHQNIISRELFMISRNYQPLLRAVFCLTLLIDMVFCLPIQIDRQNSQILRFDNNYLLLELTLLNVGPTYQIQYSNLPADDWIQTHNYLYITRSSLQYLSGILTVDVSIKDQYQKRGIFQVYLSFNNRRAELAGVRMIQSIQPQYNNAPNSINNHEFGNVGNYTGNHISNRAAPQQGYIRIAEGVINKPQTSGAQTSGNINSNNSNNTVIRQPSPQQIVDSIVTRPTFKEEPIPNIQQNVQYRQVDMTPSGPIPSAQSLAGLPLEQRIQQILAAVEQQYSQTSSGRNLVVKPIDSIFTRVPPVPEISQLLLLSNPALFLTKSIQQAVSSQMLNCQQKIAYLLQIFGVAQAHFEKIQMQSNRIIIINRLSTTNIKQLEIELVKQQNALKDQQLIVERLRKSLAVGLDLLAENYRHYNEEVLKSESNITSRNPQSNRIFLQTQILDQKQQLKQIAESRRTKQQQRQRIYKEYQIVKEEEESLEEKQRAQELKIQELESNLQTVKKNQKAYNTYTNHTQYLDNIRLAYLQRQVQVTRIRSNLQSAQLKQQIIGKSLQNLEQEIRKNQQKLDLQQQLSLNATLNNLKKALPNLQSEVDKIYYRCYRAGNITMISNITSANRNENLIYAFTISEWVKYMQNVYSADKVSLLKYLSENRSEPISISSRSNIQQLLVMPHNIFSYSWVQQYGSLINSEQDLSMFLQSDFTCLKPSTLETSSGRIKFVWKNVIIVQDQQNSKGILYELRLGSCTRIQVVNGFLPEIGRYMYWRGNLGVSGYSIYLATVV